MLDTRARALVQPVLEIIARACARVGISANALTLTGMLSGVAAAGLVASGWSRWGVATLWISGTLDAADGTLARMTRSSPLGAIMDITSDRVVEVAMILALAWRYPAARLELLVLTGVIVIAMSLFLSIAAAVVNHSAKSFHYAPGLGERTEAFVCLSLMTLNGTHLRVWTWVFIGVIVVTIVQRFAQVRRLLSGSNGTKRG
ncbi:CDP-alcohol phosphatidyltransferase family protein [bacterium]|nr:MAG: CDP-alcohol phosphatidyltransferase family protein [bacterium]